MHAAEQGLHGFLRGIAGGNHDPDGAWRRQFPDQIVKRRGCDGAFAGEAFDGIGAEIGNDQGVTAAHQAPRHVGAHLSKTYHSELHSCSLQNLFYQTAQFRDACFYVATEVHAQRAAIAVGQDLKVAAGLRRLDDSEGVLLPGNG